MDRPWSCFPGQPSSVTIQLQSVGKLLRLFLVPNQLHDGEELLMSIKLLLLLQDQHEVVSVARLHHDPVHGSRKVDVSCQEHDVLPVQGCDGPVASRVPRILAIYNWLLDTDTCMDGTRNCPRAPSSPCGASWLRNRRCCTCRGTGLCGPDIAAKLATAGRTTRQLWPAIGTD